MGRKRGVAIREDLLVGLVHDIRPGTAPPLRSVIAQTRRSSRRPGSSCGPGATSAGSPAAVGARGLHTGRYEALLVGGCRVADRRRARG